MVVCVCVFVLGAVVARRRVQFACAGSARAGELFQRVANAIHTDVSLRAVLCFCVVCLVLVLQGVGGSGWPGGSTAPDECVHWVHISACLQHSRAHKGHLPRQPQHRQLGGVCAAGTAAAAEAAGVCRMSVGWFLCPHFAGLFICLSPSTPGLGCAHARLPFIPNARYQTTFV